MNKQEIKERAVEEHGVASYDLLVDRVMYNGQCDVVLNEQGHEGRTLLCFVTCGIESASLFTRKMRCECIRRPFFLWLAPSPALAKATKCQCQEAHIEKWQMRRGRCPLCMWQSTYPIFGRAALN